MVSTAKLNYRTSRVACLRKEVLIKTDIFTAFIARYLNSKCFLVIKYYYIIS